MHSYSLIAPAKINLHLEIVGMRPDGFHEIVMILQSIALCDRLNLYPNDSETFRIQCNHPQVPINETNLAYRAAMMMAQTFPQRFATYGGVDIAIDKHIPVAAGLAGGSSNAAATIVGLNLMWNLGLTKPELQELAARIGSDVPFCILGGTAIATGRGEQIDPIYSLGQGWIVLAKYRNLGVSTPWAYQTYRQHYSDTYINDPTDIESRAARIHSGSMVKAIQQQNLTEIGKLLCNDLEQVVLPAYPQVAALKQAFNQAGVLGTMMSGSGPTVFAVCESQREARRVQQQVAATIADSELEFWLSQLSGGGITVAASRKVS